MFLQDIYTTIGKYIKQFVKGCCSKIEMLHYLQSRNVTFNRFGYKEKLGIKVELQGKVYVSLWGVIGKRRSKSLIFIQSEPSSSLLVYKEVGIYVPQRGLYEVL